MIDHIYFQIRLFAVSRMLDDLGNRVDRTEGKLGGAMKRMQKFVRETEGEHYFLFFGSFLGTICSVPALRLYLQLCAAAAAVLSNTVQSVV